MSRKKITGRTKQISLKGTAEFHQKLKELASKEKCLMIEVLEKALKLYESQSIQSKATEKRPRLSISPVKPSVSRKRSRDDKLKETSTSFKKRKFNEGDQ